MEQRINWYRTKIEKEKLKELTRRHNLPGLLQAGSFLIIYLGLTFLAVYFFLLRWWGPMVAACIAHSVFVDFMGMEASVHELSHGTPFKSKWLNEFFYRVFSFLTWNNSVHFRVSHMKHHQFTMHKGVDMEVIIEPDPYNFWDYLSWVTFDAKKFKMLIFPTLAHFFGKGDVDFFSWSPLFEKDDPNRKKMIRWARFMVIGHIVLIAVFIYFKLWVLIYLVSFSYFFVTILSKATFIIQHMGLPSNIPDWRMSCHTVKVGPIVSFLYWRMNYHVEHHMYAAVPFYKLKKLYRAIEHDVPVPQRGFLRALSKIRQIHKRQRAEPGYWYTPKIPETASPPKME